MKTNRLISLALIGSFALLASSCVKEIVSNEEQYRPAGTPISIFAATGYDNGIETRAEYSGELFSSSNTYERIDWVEGDPIRVVYNGAPGDYTVGSGITSSNEISKTELSGTLEWNGSGNHVFYALYPSRAGAGNLSNTGYVTGTIPATQNVTSKTLTVTNETIGSGTYSYNKYQPDTEHYGYLVSYESVDANSTSSAVELHFKPAFTTFEFKFVRNAGDPNPTIMSAELETEQITVGTETVHTPLTGNFGFQILGKTSDGRGAEWHKATTGTDPTTLSGTLGYKITVGFGDSGVQIPDDGVLDFSFLALPIDLNGVKITLNYAGGTKKVLRLKDGTAPDNLTWHPFEGAKKYVITNMMPNEWIYVLEQIDDFEFTGHNIVSDIGFTVVSYKYPAGDPSNKVAVPWHIEYSKNGSDYGTNASTYNNSDFMLSDLPGSASGLGSVTGEDRASNIIRPSTGTETTLPAENVSREILQGRTPKGSSTDPYDLSMYDIHGTAHAQTTANSYVVSAPGWYKFPVVYGNAITNGAPNPSAYNPYASGAPLANHWNWVWNDAAGPDKTNHDVYMTEHFLNAKNDPILSPYVLVDVSASDPKAVLVWQDTDANDEIIKYGANDLKLVGSGENAYIWFYIAPENIHQGNIVLAVRDGNGGTDGEVLWSWQIWVCEKDLTPVSSRQLMPYNLGWIDQEGLKKTTYPTRVNHYRIVQSESNKKEDFKITQIGDENAIPNNTGYNTFYQWGRKDPMTSATAKRTSQDYASQLGDWPATKLHEFTNQIPLYAVNGDYHSPSYAYGITHPWIPTQDADNGGWVNGQFYPPHEQFWHTDFRRGAAPNPYSLDADPLNGVPDVRDSYSSHYNQSSINGVSQVDAVAHNGAHYRQLSGCPFNLWNAYAYGSADFSGYDKKYKTVYDPCPPGFCVPTLGTFASIESATMEREPDKGITFIFGNGDAFFLPFSGSRGTRYTQYLVNDRPDRGVYWVDAPSNVGKSKYYVNGKWYRKNDVTGQLYENNANAQHGLGFFWYMFAKSLHLYNNIGSFPDEEDHSSYVKYSPEDVHWDTMTPAHRVGAYPQTQRTGFDDIRSNAFSIRPIVDPRY